MFRYVQDSPMKFLVDTGTSDTIISIRKFEAITVENRPNLSPMQCVAKQADGTPLSILGRATMNIRIGPALVAIPVIVSDITNDAMLGIYFLGMAGCVINVRDEQLMFEGSAVKCNPADNGSLCAKVTLRETVTIPAGHEMLIPGKISKHPGLRGLSIIESENSELNNAGAVMAKVVVDLDKT